MKDINFKNATEVAFCVDLTGSMSPCIAAVRKNIEKTCEELFQDIPDLKIGKNIGVSVYPLQCLYGQHAHLNNAFWTEVATLGEVPLCKLDNFEEATPIMTGFAYMAAGPEAFKLYENKLGDVKSANIACNTANLKAQVKKFGD